jgi:phosphoribosylformylglycinamidine (FGAM) synthase-like amidotransferase family enzyme
VARPIAFVLSGDGVNCDYESEYALTQAGFVASRVHVSTLLAEPEKLRECQMCILPGGFSYGDEIASGKVLAVKLKERLNDALHSFVDKGNLLMGICNGFQVLVQMGLLPESQPGKPRTVSLLRNKQKKFIDRWVSLSVSSQVESPYFKGLTQLDLPIRHGEGRLALEPPTSTIMEEHDPAHPGSINHAQEELVRKRAPLRYVLDVNGSFDRIAALTNEQGNILGLMPHPEAFVRWTQHPEWTLQKAKTAGSAVQLSKEDAAGLKIFKNAAQFLGVNQG